MRIDVLINYASRIVVMLAFAPWVASASPYGRPLEGDLIKSEAIFLGRVQDVVDGICLKIDLLFSIKGEFSDGDLLCVGGEYKNEFDINFLLQGRKVVFFAKRGGKSYSPFFHYASLAYLNEKNCVGMPAVFDEKTGNYIIEGFEVFVKRFGVEKIPEEFFSKGGCKEW